ncbi:hypothetical protein THAOC_04735 [Thalassiosira oceanica]|uniref:RING-type domain-containing protein n=1 Tax=Thalassiosira oceanica TaxID=159749 RepID=K0T4H0_THAOC|nr:hypothetical protein THAOC_04735 [Thalassiosira oceanica]|eukprot:EJK73628.1 hypothetical protein THAOC_04735 [Thalassiosira oceanica]
MSASSLSCRCHGSNAGLILAAHGVQIKSSQPYRFTRWGILGVGSRAQMAKTTSPPPQSRVLALACSRPPRPRRPCHRGTRPTQETTTASEASNEVVLAGEDQQQAPEAMSTSVHANSGEAEKTKHEKNTEVVNASVDKTCGICLEDSKDPLNLPCGHSFCEGCLNEWRSRYGVKEEMRRKCPICRARIPPSKEMVATLLQWRAEKERMEVNNETYSKSYRRACEFLKDAEEKVGKDWDGETVLQDRNNKQAVAMPDYVMMAIKKGDIKSVLRWINADRTEDRASAVSAEMMGLTALMLANLESNLTLMTLLLQLGADVNYRVSLGYSLIDLALNDVHVDARAHKVVRMLLSWGRPSFRKMRFKRKQYLKAG